MKKMRVLPLIGNGTYGFSEASELPEEAPVSLVTLPHLPVSFAVTTDYMEEAKNHCAAVTATNLSLILSPPANARTAELLREISHRSFTSIHSRIGNGPILNLEKRITRYYRDTGIPIRCRKLKNVEDISAVLSKGHPAALLLGDSLFRWHWVTVIGSLTYPDGTVLEIADSWHRRPRYYRPNYGSRVLGILEFYIPEEKSR